jgi:biotin carboxyl carrier protein
MRFEIELDGNVTQVVVEAGEGSRMRVRIGDGPERVLDVARPETGVLSLALDGRLWDVAVDRTEQGYDVEVGGVRRSVGVVDPRRKALRLAAGSAQGAIKTTMPGRVVRVLVAEGDRVTAGQPVVVVEAMKMENELKAPKAGVVKKVTATAGALVEAGTVLVDVAEEGA